MQLTYLTSVAVMAYGIGAEAPAPASPTATPAHAGAKQPAIVPMDCNTAYMPFSEADVAALSANATNSKAGNVAGSYSTVPTEAACKGPAGSKINGLCDLGSCQNHPVCNNCVELIISGNTTTTGTTTIPQATCSNNYFFGTVNDKIQNFCTDRNDKTYVCSGTCVGFTTCQLCISSEDPALKSFVGKS